MSLQGAEVNVGDHVRVTHADRHYRQNTRDSFSLTAEMPLIVTRVYAESLVVRTLGTLYNGNSGVREHMSFQINRRGLNEWVGDLPDRPATGRKLGKKPDDTEDMAYIDVTDPGIQWLFEDMGTFATREGYCPQYDALCAKLGIPGRPRDFSVQRTVNGVTMTATIRARTQREANEKMSIALGESKELDSPLETSPTPDFAPAA